MLYLLIVFLLIHVPLCAMDVLQLPQTQITQRNPYLHLFGMKSQVVAYDLIGLAPACSPDATYIASAAESMNDRRGFLWELADCKSYPRKRELLNHLKQIHALDWSPDGKFLATGSEDNRVVVWNMPAFLTPGASLDQTRKSLEGHSTAVTSLNWNPKGRYLASVGQGELCIWDMQMAQPHNIAKDVWKNAFHSTMMSWSKSGRYLVTGGIKKYDAKPEQLYTDLADIFLWTVENGTLKLHKKLCFPGKKFESIEELVRFGQQISHFAWSAEYLAVATTSSSVYIWSERDNFEKVITIACNDYINAIAWQSSSDYLAVAHNSGVDIYCEGPDNSIRSFVHTTDKDVLAITWCPNYAMFAYGTKDEKIVICNINGQAGVAKLDPFHKPFNGQPLLPMLHYPGQIRSLCWTKNGLLVSGSLWGKIRVHELTNQVP